MNEQKKKILIVEDEVPLLNVLDIKLTKEGYESFKAINGLEGLEMIKKHKPDLVLLDIVMPVMDGVTMAKKMKEDPEMKDTKVLILTNLSDISKLEEAVQNGGYDFLVKSNWTLDEVIEKIKEKLSE